MVNMVINFRNETSVLCAATFGFREYSNDGISFLRKEWMPIFYTNYQATSDSPPLMIKALAAFE